MPGIVEHVDVARFGDVDDEIGPITMFVGLSPCDFVIDILQARDTSQITNGIFAALLSSEPFLESQGHFLHVFSLDADWAALNKQVSGGDIM